MDISRPEYWLHPAMFVDASLRPGLHHPPARDCIVATVTTVRPLINRIAAIAFRSLLLIVVIAILASIVWILQADSPNVGFVQANAWTPNASTLLTSGK